MSFGLGSQFDTDVTGLRPGLIPNSAYYDKWYGHNTWAFSTIRSISIGQGEVKVTPLQMANIAAIHKTKVDAANFDPIIEGMRRVCYEPGGTGKRAVVEGVTVCGKTGTAQNPHGEDHSVFLAFAPMENPKIAIAVFIENAGFGGVWAAPTAGLMIDKYIHRKVKDKAKEKMIISANLLNIKAKPKKKKKP
jgi:penicillin-binding protein 2